MLSVQSQLCAIRGAFHLCFKRKKKPKKNKFIGLKVFLTMLVLSLHNPQTSGALSVCSSLPSTAQLLLPTTWGRQIQSRKNKWERSCSLCVCLCFTRGMTERMGQTISNNPRKPRESHQGGNMCVSVCMNVTKHLTIKMYFAKPEKLNFQCSRGNTNLIFTHLF